MSSGGVLQIEVTDRESPVFGGTKFGTVGPYERLHGTVFGELDPAHPLNAGIVNLDRAARNPQGTVEYRSDFRILKPLYLDRGNGCLVYDVPNRGNQPIMPRLNGAPDGGHPQHAGNGFLVRRGFTVVWSGWQGDVPPGNDRLTARFPVIPGITGMVREEFIAENTGLLGDTNIEELSEALCRHARLSRCRPERGDVDGAAARGRPARHAGRSCLAAGRRTTCRDYAADRPRL
jgi:hypothetical protein